MRKPKNIAVEEKFSLLYNSALDKKAIDPVAFDVRGLSSVADVFMMLTGASNRQIKAIVDAIEDTLREMGEKDYHIEGYDKAWWVLIDAGDIVIHVFAEEARAYYGVESLWADAKKLTSSGHPAPLAEGR